MKRVRIGRFVIAVILVGLLFVLAVPTLYAAGNTVYTGSSSLGATMKREVFRGQDLLWAVYSDTVDIKYKTSDDGGTTWSSAITLRAGGASGNRLSTWTDGFDIHYVFSKGTSNQSVYYRKGALQTDGTISWYAAEQTAFQAGSGRSIGLNSLNVAVDTNGYPFVTYSYTDSYAMIGKSSTTDGTWVNDVANGFPWTSGNAALGGPQAIVPMNSGRMYAVISRPGSSAYGYRWSGTAWSSSQSIGSGWSSFSMVAIGDDIHLTYYDSTPSTVWYRLRDYSDTESWQDVVELEDTDAGYSNISVAVTNKACVFWTDTTNKKVYYRVGQSPYELADWSDRAELFTETDDSLYSYITVSYSDEEEDILDVLFLTTDAGESYIRHISKVTQISLAVTLWTSSLEETTVTLNAKLWDDSDATIGDCYFEYGTDLTFGTETDPQSGIEEGDTWTEDITSLVQFTTYYFRADVEWTEGVSSGTFSSSPTMFRTLPGVPICTTLTATSVVETSAKMRGYLDEDGGEPCNVRFQYGLASGVYTWSTDWASGVPELTTYEKTITGLGPGTTHFFRFQVQNSAVGTPVSGEESAFNTTVALPSVVTRPATYASVTTAILNAYISSDGGEGCYVRFQYGKTTGYGTNSVWVYSYSAGEAASLQLGELDLGTTYHFRAQIYNSANGASSPISGADATFTTAATVGDVSHFVVTVVSGTEVTISWSKGSGSQKTLIKYQIGAYPPSVSGGTFGYYDVGVSTTLDGLTPGVTYYFAAWGHSPVDYWSTTAATDIATTNSIGAAAILLPPPDEPSWWFLNPSTAKIQNMPGFAIIQWQAETLGVPEGSWACIIAIMFAAFAGGILLVWSHSSATALAAVGVICFAASMAGLVPLWILFAIVMISVSIMYFVPAGRGV